MAARATTPRAANTVEDQFRLERRSSPIPISSDAAPCVPAAAHGFELVRYAAVCEHAGYGA